jgi:peptidoglycan-associated lipoprotein
MRRASLLLAAAGLGLVLTGCPSPYPKCSSDNDCKDHNEVCVQGQCQECAGDQNCKEGFSCQQNKCVPKPECTSDSTCTDGKKCRAGKCAFECESNADCGTGKCANHACLAANACSNDNDCGTGEGCEAGACAPKKAQKSCNWAAIHFDFNDANLTADARSQLDGLVDCIKSASKVTLEGNADERGTEEYNLQLSNRRAASVKKYLVDLGVPASKLAAVGYGENRPVNPGHTEEAWAANRRVEFKH